MNISAEKIVRLLLIGIFIVASATGFNVILQGVSGIPEDGLISQASVDNELRFMAVFWVAFGVYCFTLSKNVLDNKRSILYIAIVFLCSGLARLLSYLTVGEPIGLFVGAMALELSLPLLIFGLLKLMSGNQESTSEKELQQGEHKREENGVRRSVLTGFSD